MADDSEGHEAAQKAVPSSPSQRREGTAAATAAAATAAADGETEAEDVDSEGDEEDEEEEEEYEEVEEEDEPKLKYARMTGHLTQVYRGGDATSSFLVAGDKMVCPSSLGLSQC